MEWECALQIAHARLENLAGGIPPDVVPDENQHNEIIGKEDDPGLPRRSNDEPNGAKTGLA